MKNKLRYILNNIKDYDFNQDLSSYEDLISNYLDRANDKSLTNMVGYAKNHTQLIEILEFHWKGVK